MTRRNHHIGLLVPASNRICEQEIRQFLPTGVFAHVARVLETGQVPWPKDDILPALNLAVKEIMQIAPEAIAFCCTVGSFIKSVDFDKKIISYISKGTNLSQCTTTGTAVVEALKELNFKKISVATPYSKEVNDLEVKFFKANNIEVVQIQGLEKKRNHEIASIDIEDVYKIAKSVDCKKAQGIFISCTNLPAIDVIKILEKDLGKPIITSNQATAWRLLKYIGVKNDRLPHLGALFTY